MPAFQLNGLGREQLTASNAMPLHELYVASLGGDGQAMEPAWAMALEANFGSVERWREEFVAMGKALGGSGWLILSFQPRAGTLVNQGAADHTQALAGGVPLLALDMDEQAHHLDFGAVAGASVDAFTARIAWAGVYARYQAAVHAASEGLAVEPDELQGRLLLDVRRAGAYANSPSRIAGARWRDPARVADWAHELPTDREVVVYCVYGHEVGRATALRLRAAGVQARFLRGGIDAWRAAGRPLDEEAET
jgi:Fe-Mn family superoxide dismutase